MEIEKYKSAKKIVDQIDELKNHKRTCVGVSWKIIKAVLNEFLRTVDDEISYLEAKLEQI